MLKRLARLGSALIMPRSGDANPIFVMQLAVSAVGMVLSASMLFMGRDPAIYLPVVTSIVGYWLPAPKKPVQQSPSAMAEVADNDNTPATAARSAEDSAVVLSTARSNNAPRQESLS